MTGRDRARKRGGKRGPGKEWRSENMGVELAPDLQLWDDMGSPESEIIMLALLLSVEVWSPRSASTSVVATIGAGLLQGVGVAQSCHR
jgi:hypothetical protein